MNRIPVILLISIIMALSACSRKFNIVVLPDTQTYAKSFPDIFYSQLSWIDSNRKNIDFVLHVGDITQDNIPEEWQIARNAFDRIENTVPYSIIPGNHDMGPLGRAEIRETEQFNQWFSLQRRNKKYFGGSFQEGRMDNIWHRMKTGGRTWVIIGMEFGPRNEVLEWAGQVARANADALIIVFTHAYMHSDSTRMGPGDKPRPQDYGLAKDTGALAVNDGEQIWEKLINVNPNIMAVFSGHVLGSGVGTLVSRNASGLPVYQMLANFQAGVRGSVNGGNGFLRIINFDLKNSSIEVKTFSPYLNSYKEEAAHNFRFDKVPFKTR